MSEHRKTRTKGGEQEEKEKKAAKKLLFFTATSVLFRKPLKNRNFFVFIMA
jgi:hypothetical protein